MFYLLHMCLVQFLVWTQTDVIWTTLTVTENNIETELIISELTWIALYAQLLKILISSWNSEVLFVEPEVLRKNKTSFTGRDGQCLLLLLLLLLCCCWRTASGFITATHWSGVCTAGHFLWTQTLNHSGLLLYSYDLTMTKIVIVFSRSQ